MQVEVLEHTDVRGNKLLYLRLKNTKNEECLVNIGQKTFDSVKKLVANEDPIIGKPVTDGKQTANK